MQLPYVSFTSTTLIAIVSTHHCQASMVGLRHIVQANSELVAQEECIGIAQDGRQIYS